MPDPISAMDVITHPGTVAGGSGITVAAIFRWLQGREARELSTQIALMQQKLDAMAVAMEKHSGMGERLALAEQSLKALHSRMDAYDSNPRRRR